MNPPLRTGLPQTTVGHERTFNGEKMNCADVYAAIECKFKAIRRLRRLTLTAQIAGLLLMLSSTPHADIAPYVQPVATSADLQMIEDLRTLYPEEARFFGGLDENGVGALCLEQAVEMERWYRWRGDGTNGNTLSVAHAILSRAKDEKDRTSEREGKRAAAIRYVFSLPLPPSSALDVLERYAREVSWHWGALCRQDFRLQPVIRPDTKQEFKK
ncbi:hypothetical protein SAMN05518854_13117 [Variovorax sp. YR266]|nr:hypothetical protein SAMN05518854_13117 [Variovorax sp. YR266]